MRNVQIKYASEERWLSRSMTAVVFIFGSDENKNTYVLASKRSQNTPDEQGKWVCPCGYLDYDETLEKCAVREVKEETGLDIEEQFLRQVYINSKPTENKQNVTVRYEYMFGNIDKFKIPDGYENYEVGEVKWIKILDINNYVWAFDHDLIIESMV